MKIVRVEVDDPGRRGYANSPSLIVHLTGEPRPSGEVNYASLEGGVYAWRHYGPFVKFLWYSYNSQTGGAGGEDWPDIGLGGAWSSRAGAFNQDVLPDKPVVDVFLQVGADRYQRSGWSLRARPRTARDQEARARLAPAARCAGCHAWRPQVGTHRADSRLSVAWQVLARHAG